MDLVDRAQSQSDRIDRFLAAKARLAAITSAELQKVAARYLDPAQRLDVVALPKVKEAAQ
jgi:zinc protease